MIKFASLALFVSLLSVSSFAANDDWAKTMLEKSSRHGEWVKVKAGNREVNCWVVYPEVKEKATAVLLIHEIFGLSNWVKLMADDVAAAGFIAIAPDLLSGMGEGGGGTDKVKDVSRTIQSLPPDQITADLNACVDYVSKLPAANGKVAVAGFCWGGGQSHRFAMNNADIKGAFIFYGSTKLDPADLAKIKGPVYGFYAENDARITKAVPDVEKAMKAAGKTFEPVIYEGAGHGFMRAGEDPGGNEANKKARTEGFKRMVEAIKKL